MMIELKEIANKIKNNEENYIEYYNRNLKIKKTYRELYQDVMNTLSFIQGKGVQSGQKVGIMSSNKYEWLLVDLACLFGGFILVAIHTKDFENKMEELAKEFEIKLVFVEKKYLDLPLKNVNLIQLDNLLEVIVSEKAGEKELGDFKFTANDVFTIVFTSGTTGIPKAIGLKVKAIEHTISVSSKQFNYKNDDKTIIFLPLSVFTSRLYIYGAFLLDFNVIITVPEMVLNALRLYRPTILQAVPNFFESICNVFFQQITASLINTWVYRAYNRLGKILPKKIKEKLRQKIYGEIQNYFGGNIRVMITGTAPISVKVLEFFNAAGMPLYESYGLNETGVLALNSPSGCKIGSVGKLLPGYEIKTDENGQILVKSDYFWSEGYLKAAADVNRKIFLDNGYIATGDIGWLDNEGFLFLKGRSSEVITLSNGQKVHPSVVEKHMSNSSLIKQSMVVGNNRPYLTMIIVRNSESLDFKQIQEEVKRLNRDLPPHQQVKYFVMTDEPFSLSNNQLSNNLKLNRVMIYQTYEKEIESLY